MWHLNPWRFQEQKEKVTSRDPRRRGQWRTSKKVFLVALGQRFVKCFPALSESVRQLGEKVSQMQSEAVLQAEDMNRRVSKMESFFENVVAPALIPSATVPPHTAAAPAVFRDFADTDSCCKAIQKEDGQPK
ncbi:hypothetical protein MTO96_032295 [Rhipicephalus appendiculatus]